MIITKAVVSDASKLYTLEQALFSEVNYPLSRNAFYYHIKNNLLYVAKQDDEVVGYILTLIKRSHPKIYSLGVSEAFRGQNIASKLFVATINELKALGFEKLELEVRTDNIAAIELYKKLGFEIQRTSEGFYLDGCDAYIMLLHEKF
jgi:ribosomal-protein-alanine N-acetyltransferase